MNRRATFGPVVLLGLGAAALAAVAGNKPWTEVQPAGGECGLEALPAAAMENLARSAPLAGALGLVVLAAWGVLLVTRGWTRRAMALLATLGAAGYLAVAVEGYWSLQEASLDAATEQLGGPVPGCDPIVEVTMASGWWLAALAAGVLLVLAGLLATWLVPAWPEMGTRYDAPAGAAASPADPASRTNIDLWKQLDEGHDPTLGPGPGDDGPRA